MKFETIIIGGGLAGLTAAIRLAEQGRKVGLVTAGRSALHFHSGSFGLLGFDDKHQAVESIADALPTLPADHPYRKIGLDNLINKAEVAADLLRRAGTMTDGTASANHTRISPLGVLRPSWLTLKPLATLEDLRALPGRKLAIVAIAGFLDFYPRFIAATLESEGFKCEIFTVDTPDLKALRSSESEMRAADIARIMNGEAVDRLCSAVNTAIAGSDADAVLMPAIADFDKECLRMRGQIDRPAFYLPTMGVSVPGIAIFVRMMRHFTSLGGRLFNGHTVVAAEYDGDRLVSVTTDRLEDDPLRADDFILASGNFFSRGLVATPEAVVEPALALDTVSPAADARWTADIFESQPLFAAGVATDGEFRAIRGGKPLKNVYAIGSILSGADAAREDSGSGIAMLTAIAVADKIINK